MYCTVQEVRDTLKPDVLNSLIGAEKYYEEEEREALIRPVIAAAIDDAGAEIDGYLARRYQVPLPNPPPVINKFCKDMAVYNLFSRSGIDEKERESNYLTRYNAAVKFFTLVAEGKVSLGTEDPGAAARIGFTVSSQPRLFSRDKMKGM